MDDCFEKTALFWQQLHAKIWAAIRSGSPKTILTTQRYFGTANGNQYGIPASSRNVVRNAFNETAQNIPQESSRQNNSRGSSRTYNDELYDSLLRAGAAITEQDALGESGVSFSENAPTVQDIENSVSQIEKAVLGRAIDDINDEIYNQINDAQLYSVTIRRVREMFRGNFRETVFSYVNGNWSDVTFDKNGRATVTSNATNPDWRGHKNEFRNNGTDIRGYSPSELAEGYRRLGLGRYNGNSSDGGSIWNDIVTGFLDREREATKGIYSHGSLQHTSRGTQARLTNKESPDGGSFSFSENAPVSSEMDAEYMDAIERGDTETAQELVNEAADEAGYTIKAYHGTQADRFNVFDKELVGKGTDQFGAGFYFATDQEAASHYGSTMYSVYLDIKNPIRIQRSIDGGDLYDVEITPTKAYKILKKHPLMYDAEESPLGDFFDSYWEEGPKDWMIREMAKQYTSIGLLDGDRTAFRDYPNELHEAIRDVLGYDGVEVTFDNTDGKFYVAWFDTQMKSADPVTYDDNGNVIPLSERFNREKNDIRFSENAPTKRQSRLNEAWELFDNNSTPEAYYESNPRGFDLQTSNLLRGLMLRNGENVGGTLSDARMERIAEIFAGANRRNALSLSLSSPVRVFEDVTGWGGRTAEERTKNVRNGNLLKNTYYEYGNLQAANRETWIAGNMRPVIEATTKQNPVNSCPDGRGAAGAARRIRLRRKGLFRLLCRRCRYAPCPPDMEEYEVPAGPGRCLNVRGPYRKPCRTCSAAP